MVFRRRGESDDVPPSSRKRKLPVVAIDGPAGAGKGTLARRISSQLHMKYLDTGTLYRAVAYKALTQGVDPQDETKTAHIAETILGEDITTFPLKDEVVSRTASIISAHPLVRQRLFEAQKGFALTDEPQHRGAVLDGRDIGTRIFPKAAVKFFITASLETRAKRRFKELQSLGKNCIYEDVLADIQARDARDSNRSVAPLVPADDAIVIDTSNLDPDQVVEKVLSVIHSKGIT